MPVAPDGSFDVTTVGRMRMAMMEEVCASSMRRKWDDVRILELDANQVWVLTSAQDAMLADALDCTPEQLR